MNPAQVKRMRKLIDEIYWPKEERKDWIFHAADFRLGYREAFDRAETILVGALERLSYYGHLKSTAMAKDAEQALKQWREG